MKICSSIDITFVRAIMYKQYICEFHGWDGGAKFRGTRRIIRLKKGLRSLVYANRINIHDIKFILLRISVFPLFLFPFSFFHCYLQFMIAPAKFIAFNYI